MAAPNSAPQMASPGYPKRAYCQKGETNFPFKGQGQQGSLESFGLHSFNTSLSSAPFRAIFGFTHTTWKNC